MLEDFLQSSDHGHAGQPGRMRSLLISLAHFSSFSCSEAKQGTTWAFFSSKESR